MAEAYWTAARSGPEWSRTITSWIMVSSRWVAGSSTGTRAVSTCSTMKSVTQRPQAGDGLRRRAEADVEEPGEGGPAGGRRQRAEREEERRLEEGGVGRLPAGAHPLEGAAGVERREHQEDAPQPPEVGEDHEVVGEGERGEAAQQRRQQAGDQRGRQQDQRPGRRRARW